MVGIFSIIAASSTMSHPPIFIGADKGTYGSCSNYAQAYVCIFIRISVKTDIAGLCCVCSNFDLTSKLGASLSCCCANKSWIYGI